MNKFKKLLVGTFSLLAMVGCSDDVLNTAEQDNPGNKTDDPNAPGVYIGVNFTMPGMGANRSYTNGNDTSNGGEEVGTDIENNVNEVLLILATNQTVENGVAQNNFGFIGASTVLKNKIYQHTNKSYHSTAKFDKTDLNTYYERTPAASR
ncbi:MAG: hypothetical protein K2K92_06600, partial [Duncaniella sp.]|nr:hypothetical protein [Duncaniella sp.]